MKYFLQLLLCLINMVHNDHIQVCDKEVRLKVVRLQYVYYQIVLLTTIFSISFVISNRLQFVNNVPRRSEVHKLTSVKVMSKTCATERKHPIFDGIIA